MSLIQMSGSAAVMIVMVVIIRTIGLNRLPKRTFLVLWDLVLLRLLIPVDMPAPFSVYSLMQSRLTAKAGAVTTILPVASQSANTANPAKIPQLSDVATSHLTEGVSGPNLHILTVLWAVVAGALLLLFLGTYIREYRRFSTSIPDQNDFADWWRKLHPLRRNYQIRTYRYITSPLTYGVFRPVILLSAKMDSYDKESLDCILTHEWIHIRRFDTLRKLLLTLVLCLHWFNPLVWIMYVLMNRDIELSCDESVLRHMEGDRRRNYALTLISLEERRNGILPLYSSFSKSSIERRVKAIMSTKKYTRAIILGAVALVFAVACVFGTTGQKHFSDLMLDGGTISAFRHQRNEDGSVEFNAQEYDFGANSEEAAHIREILERYTYRPTFKTLTTSLSGSYDYPDNELDYWINISFMDQTWTEFDCLGNGEVAIRGEDFTSAVYHVGGFGSGDGYAMMEELNSYLLTCEPTDDSLASRMHNAAREFLDEIYTTNRGGRYDGYQDALADVENPDIIANALNDYYAICFEGMVTDELYEKLMANRIPMKYDSHYADTPYTLTRVTLSNRTDGVLDGTFDFDATLTPDSGADIQMTGTISIDPDTMLVSAFWEG